MMKLLKNPLLIAALAASTLGISAFMMRIDPAGKPTIRYMIHTPMSSPYSARNMIGWLSRNGYDVAGFNWQQGNIEVITDTAGIQKLESANIHGSVIPLHAPRQRMATDDDPSGDSIDYRYLNSQKTEAMLKALAAQFPQITHLQQIGHTLQDKPIWALLISSTPNIQDGKLYQKPSIIFDGLHHAREIMTTEIVMDVAQQLLGAAQARNPEAMKIIDTWNVWVVPMLNVDGSDVVWASDSMWRKNTRSDRFNIYGVDINRNYPFKWNSCGGSSNSQHAQDYHGTGGASEPETQAMMNLGALAQPAASLSYHSYSELVLYPYGCNGVLSGENALLEKIGKELAGMLPADSKHGTYTPGTPWQILYAVDGDSMSYMHSEFGATAFTFEVNQDFQPSYSLREPTLQKHRVAWQYFMKRIDTNLLTIKVAGSRGEPVVAAIDISTLSHAYGEKRFHTNPGGNFFKVLDPGNYTVRVTLANGHTTEVPIQMKGQAQTIPVQLQ